MKKEHIYLLLGVLSLSLSACTTYPKINSADLKSEMDASRVGTYGQAMLHAELSEEKLDEASTVLEHLEKGYYWNINEKQKALEAAKAAAHHRLQSEKEMCKWLMEVHSQNHHKTEGTHHTVAYFHTGSAVAFKIEDESIGRVGRWLQAHPDATVTVTASADTVGKAAENQALSENRAKAVVQRLVKEGVRPGQLTVKAFGEVGSPDNTPNQNYRVATITTSHPNYIDCPNIK